MNHAPPITAVMPYNQLIPKARGSNDNTTTAIACRSIVRVDVLSSTTTGNIGTPAAR